MSTYFNIKCLYSICYFLLFSGLLYAQKAKYEPVYLKDKNSKLQADAQRLTNEGWIEFKNEPDTISFFEQYAKELTNSSPHLKFKKLKNTQDEQKMVHQRYQLYYKNMEVEGIQFILHSMNGRVKTANGKTIEGLDFDTEKKITEKDAIRSALSDLGLTNTESEKIRTELVVVQIDIDDYSQTNFRLAYKMNLTQTKPLDVLNVYVDAYSGKVIKKISVIHKCFVPNHKHENTFSFGSLPNSNLSTAQPLINANFVPFNFNNVTNNRYGTLQNIETEPLAGTNDQRLAMTTVRPYPNNYTETLPAALHTKRYTTQALFEQLLPQFFYPFPNTPSRNTQDAAWHQLPEIQNGNNNWGMLQQEATTAHWAAQKTYDYYINNRGRYGPADNGLAGRIVTNVPNNAFGPVNETFLGPFNISFGNGAGWDLTVIQSDAGQNWGTMDVVAHEITHSFTRHTSNLAYQKESGAINEAISDIIGMAVERKNLPTWDWRLGEDIPLWGPFRDMQNPLLRGQPEILGGTAWVNTNGCNPNAANDNCGVHTNSGVMNKWFYLLNTGGWFNGQYVNAINPDHAERIVFITNANYLQPNDNYAQLAFISAEVARILYGQCSVEHRSVADAWHAVGVGGNSSCPADCNYTITATTNNSSPLPNSQITLTANCSGSGCQGISYEWWLNNSNLGAGQTKTITVSNNTGSYVYSVYVTKTGCNFSSQDVTVNVTNNSTCPNVGSISYQRWENIGGGTGIQDLRNNTNNLNNGPSTTQTLSLFEAPSDVMDNYGVRIRGYVCPPTTGNYTFWIAGDDNVELWISPNDQPSGLSRIAYHNAWTPSREWGWFGTQQSAPVTLQAGQRYYVEALMKEGSGGDNLAVGWQLPNGSLERPIPGNRLIPFAGGGGSSCNFSVAPTTSNGTPSCGASVTLNANCSGSDCSGVSYTWSGNGLSSSNSSVSTNVPSSNGTYTYTVTASKSGCGNQTGSVNVTVSGCSGGGGSLNQCIESESSSGSGAITSDPNASNGSTRGEENNYNHYVDYVVTNVPSAGTYYVKLRYYSSAAPTIGVQINGGGSSSISLPSSGSWNIVWTEHTFTVSLSAGTNTIRIQGTGGGSCRQDRICVSSNPPRIGLEKESLSTDTEASILELYPNPTGGKVTVQYYLEKGQKASLQFINANGQVLLQKALTGEGGWQKTQTDLSEQPEGSYAVRMETQEKIVSRKFLIIK